MNSCARKMQQNGHKCHAAIPSLQQQRQYKLDQFFRKSANCISNLILKS